MPDFIKIHQNDNVAVALRTIPAGPVFGGVSARAEIPQGHKRALLPMKEQDQIVKYGFSIGHATTDIAAGDWVHTHNMATNLSGEIEYKYDPQVNDLKETPPQTFQGYRRRDGKAGIRNEIWIIPTVGCVNDIAKALAEKNQDLVSGSIDGLYTFSHPYGCSQTGEDHAQTRKLLAALTRHPNAGAVLVLGLGCENLTHEQFVEVPDLPAGGRRDGCRTGAAGGMRGLCFRLSAREHPGVGAGCGDEVRRFGRPFGHYGQSAGRPVLRSADRPGRIHYIDRGAGNVRSGRLSFEPVRE